MVKDGRLPRPIKLSPGRAGRLRFNKADVLAAIARLNGEGSK
jgi:predicted DNA-binding transcriptional regulator AlpA